MFLAVMKKQAQGVFNLTLPLVVAYLLNPAFVSSLSGMIACSLAIGVYIFYLHFRQTSAAMNQLSYKPCAEYQPELDKIIEQTPLDPKSVNIRYGFSNEMISLAMFNTIVIDPLLWHEVEKDSEMVKAKSVIDQHIPLTQEQKNRLKEIKQLLTPEALRFIVKHELGHIYYHYSWYALARAAILAAAATFVGLTTALAFSSSGFVAILFGMISGGLADLAFSYLSNALLKSRDEKNADFFAAQHCSPEELTAAADFFEKHQTIVDEGRKPQGVLGMLPSVMLTGHPDGKTRASQLRSYANK